jgi:biopolymer transport protein ExbB
MKLTPFLFALGLGAAVLVQDASAQSGVDAAPVLLAQAGTTGGRREAVATPSPVNAAPLPARDTAAQPVATDTTTIPASTARRAPADEGTNLWELLRSGGWAMIPLGFLSVLTVMLVLAYLFTLRRGAILTPHYMNTADVLLKKRDYLGLLAISSRHSEAVARIVQRTLDFATKNPNASFETIREIAETEGSAQASALQHRVTYLADIGMLAPMIGLLGTVIGIISSFGMLGSEQARQVTQNRDMLLAAGVSEALVATASGLILGIIAMGFYSLFRNRVQSLISDMEIASAHVLGLLAVAFDKKREKSRVAIEDEF